MPLSHGPPGTRKNSVMLNYNLAQQIPSLDSISGSGSFVNLDNLALGLPANVPHQGDPGLTLDESRSHLSIWCMLSSPLILNYNIFESEKVADPEITRMVMNKEAVAINQDPLRETAVRIDGSRAYYTMLPRLPLQWSTWSNGEQLAKPLANGDVAVLIFNRFNASLNVALDFRDIGNTSMRCWIERGIWQGRDLGRLNYTFNAALLPHVCRFLRLSAPSQCKPQ